MVTSSRRVLVRKAPMVQRMAAAPRRTAVRPKYVAAAKKAVRRVRKTRDPAGYVARAREAIATPKRSFLGSVAQGVGSMFGSSIGGLAGVAGDAFSKILGLGAYSIKNNTLVEEMITGRQVPVMHSSDESVIIRHREYIGDISSTTAFTNNTYYVNPGLASTFPWLSSIACNFEQYKWRGLIFEFKSTSANALNSTNTALGSISIASEYNVNAQPFVNKAQVLNNMWTCTAKPSETFIHPIECAPQFTATNSLYVRTSVPSGTQDLRLYDLVNIQVVSDGSQATANVGELWASYEIELFKPQVGAGGLAYNSQGTHYRLSSASTSAFFGTSRTSKGDYIGLTFVGNNSIAFPKGCIGNFLINLSYSGSSASCGSPSFAFVNCASVAWFYGGTAAVVGNITATIDTYSFSFVINIPDATAAGSIALSGGTLPASITSADLTIQQLNGYLS